MTRTRDRSETGQISLDESVLASPAAGFMTGDMVRVDGYFLKG